jgi:hypothetical protein
MDSGLRRNDGRITLLRRFALSSLVTPVKTGVHVCASKHKADWILVYAAMTKCHYNKLA